MKRMKGNTNESEKCVKKKPHPLCNTMLPTAITDKQASLYAYISKSYGSIKNAHKLEKNVLQNQVDKIHRAVHNDQLKELQEAVTDESLILVKDHTGLPPLQKAVLFEWLSVVQYISRAFPKALNHPDHVSY